MNRIFWLGSACVALIFMVSVSGSADHSWANYHWARTTNTFTLQVIDSVVGDWQNPLDDSITAWSSATPLDLLKTSTDESSRTRRRCRMVKGQIRVCNSTYGYNGWLGLATIGIDSYGHIDRGTAKVNDSYSSYWADLRERNHVMCQEIGHLFGLGHTSEDGSSQNTCMDYSNSTTSEWPNQHDYDLLADIYGHLDSYDSYAIVDSGGTGETGGNSGCNAPPGKGCNKGQAVADIPPMGIRINRIGNHEIWVSPRNDGGLWIHHVLLAPGF